MRKDGKNPLLLLADSVVEQLYDRRDRVYLDLRTQGKWQLQELLNSMRLVKDTKFFLGV